MPLAEIICLSKKEALYLGYHHRVCLLFTSSSLDALTTLGWGVMPLFGAYTRVIFLQEILHYRVDFQGPCLCVFCFTQDLRIQDSP